MKKNEFDATEFNNIKEIIYNSSNKYNKKTAFVIKNKIGKEVKYTNISYTQLLNDVNSFGTGLYSLGLKGKRVAVIGKNRYEWMVSHLGNLFGSILSIPLDKDLQLEELENSLIRSKADAIVFDIKIIEKIKERSKTNINEFICMDKIDGYKNFPDLLKQGEELVRSGDTEFIDNKINDNAMSILLFTSGTTSQSKAVMLSHKNIVSNIYALQ